MTGSSPVAAPPVRPSLLLRMLLIAVMVIYLIGETALMPFLPQLFHRMYGINSPAATGQFLWICRIVGLIALPLWGLAARRWPLHRLVLIGLCCAAVFDACVGFAPNYTGFTVLSAGAVAANAALLLAYPAFVAEHSRRAVERRRDGQHARLVAVRSMVVVFHVAAVASTLVGGWVSGLPDPRLGVSAFAVVDLLLAVLILRVLRRLPVTRRRSTPAPMNNVGVRRWWLLLTQAALIGVAFDFALAVPRVFFVKYAAAFPGVSPGSFVVTVLIFLPSVTALLTLPATRRCYRRLDRWMLPVAALVCIAGFVWEYAADGLFALICGRVLLGLGLGLAQVAVEMTMFRSTGTAGPAFTAVETVRSAGLLLAPPVAATAVTHEVALPYLVAGAALACVVVASLPKVPTPVSCPTAEEPSALAPTRAGRADAG
ncbi:MFS transporter [Streptomyces sioyaensis]|uniref:MFS transporter n=1 Tax=Streptomyces sioyaensis TaxID=67364 RepID=UPI00367C3DAF